jgi:parallel beta helix pectate lyase-like protein/type IX secretion system substrate protein
VVVQAPATLYLEESDWVISAPPLQTDPMPTMTVESGAFLFMPGTSADPTKVWVYGQFDAITGSNLTCQGIGSEILVLGAGKATISGISIMDCHQACLLVQDSATLRIASGSALTFSNGGFIAPKGGVLEVEDGVSLVMDATAGPFEVGRGGATIKLGLDALIQLNQRVTIAPDSANVTFTALTPGSAWKKIQIWGDSSLVENAVFNGGGSLAVAASRDTVRSSTFTGGSSLVVSGVARPAVGNLLEGNTITGANQGIVVRDGAEAVLRTNVISGSLSRGIEVQSGATATIEGDAVSTSVSYGILYKAGSSGSIANANVSASGDNGIYILDSQGVQVDSSSVTNSAKSGIIVSGTGASATITGNYFSGNTNHGMGVTGSGAFARMEGNTSTGNKTGAFVANGASGTLQGNQIESNSKYGIKILSASSAELEANVVTQNGDSGIYVDDTQVQSSGNWITENTFHGIDIVSASQFAMDFWAYNTVGRNDRHEIKVGSVSASLFAGGSITGSDGRNNIYDSLATSWNLVKNIDGIADARHNFWGINPTYSGIVDASYPSSTPWVNPNPRVAYQPVLVAAGLDQGTWGTDRGEPHDLTLTLASNSAASSASASDETRLRQYRQAIASDPSKASDLIKRQWSLLHFGKAAAQPAKDSSYVVLEAVREAYLAARRGSSGSISTYYDGISQAGQLAILVTVDREFRAGRIDEGFALVGRYWEAMETPLLRKDLLLSQAHALASIGDYQGAITAVDAASQIVRGDPDSDYSPIRENYAELAAASSVARKGPEPVVLSPVDVALNRVALVEDSAPEEYEVLGGYPNPFNPQTAVPVNLPEAADVSLKVYDLLGRVVAVLADGEMPAGRHTVIFDGSRLATGVYFIHGVVRTRGSQVIRAVQRVSLVK